MTPDHSNTIAAFNDTAAPFPDTATLHGLFEAQADRRPSAIAVICDHPDAPAAPLLTFAELNERANRLAHYLRDAGVKPGQIVALMVERSLAMLIGIFAVLKAGAAYLPIASDTPRGRLDYMLRDGNVELLLVHRNTAGKAPPGVRIVNLDDDGVHHGSAANLVPANTASDLAYVIYTSGSTGKPKGVMIEHRSVVNRLHWMQHAYPIGANDVIMQKTPYAFDVSVWEIFWWALSGAAVCVLRPGGERNPAAIVQAIDRHRVTVMHFVPSMLNVFLGYLDGSDAAVAARLGPVRQVFASGEALSPSHVGAFNRLWGRRTGARLTNLYGPTEATVDVTAFDCPTQEPIERIPIGRPIHNTRLYVIRDGREVAIGDTGELCIAGVGLARGYLNDPDLTAERFTSHPADPRERIYRTGDVARWLPDGHVEYLGREDHQVKIRGFRIELGEIENAIRDHPAVSDCVVMVRRYSESIILIVAYIVWKAAPEVAALKAALETHLPSHMIPNHFAAIADIPLTSSGKADRKALPDPVLQARPDTQRAPEES
jgi:amino acid adenylation domain-containing protein